MTEMSWSTAAAPASTDVCASSGGNASSTASVKSSLYQRSRCAQTSGGSRRSLVQRCQKFLPPASATAFCRCVTASAVPVSGLRLSVWVSSSPGGSGVPSDVRDPLPVGGSPCPTSIFISPPTRAYPAALAAAYRRRCVTPRYVLVLAEQWLDGVPHHIRARPPTQRSEAG